MIFIVTAENRGQFEPELLQMHRHRKAAFIDTLRWRIPATGELEVDQYDCAETIYLLAKVDPEGELLASARLLPTDAPHLLADFFPHACADAAPCGPNVWEASRYCAAPHVSRPRRVRLLLEIICGILEAALLFGVARITLTANRALLPVALHCGWEAHILGPTLPDGADQITAIEALITPQGLERVRTSLHLQGPVSRFPARTLRIAA